MPASEVFRRLREAGIIAVIRAQAVKLFPASTGGPCHLRSLRGPFPELEAVPTGGIEVGDVAEWFAAGAMAIGAGSELCPRSLMERGSWHDITARARRFVQAVRGNEVAAAALPRPEIGLAEGRT